MAEYRFPAISFGGNVVPSRKPAKFAATPKPASAMTSDKTSTAGERPQTVMDPTGEYIANHGAFASAGITLEDHVGDWAVNAKSIIPLTEGQWAAVKKKSAALNEAWAAGKVVDPWR